MHLAVVDPGVGGDRRGIALKDAGGRLFVGPDNGLLMQAADQAGPVGEAVELELVEPAAGHGSATFHARDVFAPAAARLALGAALAELGVPVEPDSLRRLRLPEPAPIRGGVEVSAPFC